MDNQYSSNVTVSYYALELFVFWTRSRLQSSLLAGTIHRYCVVDICALIMIGWSSDGVTEEDLMSTESELGCVHFDCPVDILYHLQSCL